MGEPSPTCPNAVAAELARWREAQARARKNERARDRRAVEREWKIGRRTDAVYATCPRAHILPAVAGPEPEGEN